MWITIASESLNDQMKLKLSGNYPVILGSSVTFFVDEVSSNSCYSAN